MKRIAAIFLLLTLCLSLCACGRRLSEEEAIAIALEEAVEWTGLELSADMAACERAFGEYRVTFGFDGLGSPVTIVLDAETGAILAQEANK